MEKNQIFIKTGTKYKKMTRELLEESNLAELIGDKNKMVGIKPNLVSPSDPANGGTTHPEIVAGILEYLKENGFKNSMILEGSWVGDRTADAFEVCGYRQLCDGVADRHTHLPAPGPWQSRYGSSPPDFHHPQNPGHHKYCQLQ